jgi:hypothetical protein
MEHRVVTWAGPWALGVAAALSVVGPALQPGSLLSLDLVFTPRLPVPPGVWGLGPELPRRVPLGAPLAWLAHFIGGESAGKLLLFVCLAAAVAGATQLARRVGASPFAAAGAGLLYGLSPFTLTRVGAGHWGLLAAMAVLPFAAPHLAQPGRRLAATYVAALALGTTGFAGGLLALALGVSGFWGSSVRDPGLSFPRRGRALGVVAVGQLGWLVPGLVVALTGPGIRLADGFRTDVSLLTFPSLLAGRGFWRHSSQIGLAAGPATIAGLVLLAAALWGRRLMPRSVAAPLAIAAGLATLAALASVLPGLDRGFRWVTGGVGSPLREGQRLMPLALLWIALAAALGCDRMAAAVAPRLAPLIRTAPVAVALVLAGPGLWGVGGRLEPVPMPQGYADAARAIDREPGPVLALPWHQYLNLSFANGRRVLNPLPDRLGGDVIASADPELGPTHREDVDRRGPRAAAIAAEARAGERVSSDLYHLGIRWVALMEEVDWRDYDALARDPLLDRVQTGPGVRLYRVRPDPTELYTMELGFGVEPLFGPVAHTVRRGEPDDTTWNRPGQPGWLRGWHSFAVSADGRLTIPPGDGPVWYWPALVVIGADVVMAIALALAVRSLYAT